VVVLGLPQAALTLGNAIVATVAENNALFPDRRITVRTVAIDHGIMNLVGTSLGGVPMCHGAGGLAGHVRFGARTGGAVIMLGVFILFVALFLADSVAVLFKLFPASLLGVILLFGGLELAAGAHDEGRGKEDRLRHAAHGRRLDVEHGRGLPGRARPLARIPQGVGKSVELSPGHRSSGSPPPRTSTDRPRGHGLASPHRRSGGRRAPKHRSLRGRPQRSDLLARLGLSDPSPARGPSRSPPRAPALT